MAGLLESGGYGIAQCELLSSKIAFFSNSWGMMNDTYSLRGLVRFGRNSCRVG